MIIISAQPNRHSFFSVGAQKQKQRKKNAIFSFNRKDDKPLIVFDLMMNH